MSVHQRVPFDEAIGLSMLKSGWLESHPMGCEPALGLSADGDQGEDLWRTHQ